MPTTKEKLIKEVALIMINSETLAYSKRDWPHLKKELDRLDIETLEHLKRIK